MCHGFCSKAVDRTISCCVIQVLFCFLSVELVFYCLIFFCVRVASNCVLFLTNIRLLVAVFSSVLFI
jgi:hypothetical protein